MLHFVNRTNKKLARTEYKGKFNPWWQGQWLLNITEAWERTQARRTDSSNKLNKTHSKNINGGLPESQEPSEPAAHSEHTNINSYQQQKKITHKNIGEKVNTCPVQNNSRKS